MVGMTEVMSLKRPRLGSKASGSLGPPAPAAAGTHTPTDTEDDLKSRSRKATRTSESDSSIRPAHKAASAPLTGTADDGSEYTATALLKRKGLGDSEDSDPSSPRTRKAVDLSARGMSYLERIRDENVLPLKKLIENMKSKHVESVSCENLHVKSQELGDDFIGEMLRMKLLYSTFNVLLTDTTLRQCSCVESSEARQVCLLQCYQCFFECDGEAILSCYLMNAATPEIQRAAVYFASLISKIGEYSSHPQDLSLPDVDTENQSLDSYVQIISFSNSVIQKEVIDGMLDLLIGRRRGLVDEGKEEVFGIFSQVITRPGIWRRISELLDLADPKTRLYALSSLFLLLKRNTSNRTTLRNLNQWHEWLVPLLKIPKDLGIYAKEERSITKDAPSEEKSAVSTYSTRKSAPESGGVKISDEPDFISEGLAGEAGGVLDLKMADPEGDEIGDVGYEVVLQIGIIAMTLVDSIGSEDGVNTFFDLLPKVIRRIRVRKSESHDILRFLFFSMVKLMRMKLIVPEYWEAEFTSSLAWTNVLGLLDLCKDFILYDVTDRPIDSDSIWDFRFHTPKNLKLLDQLLCKEILEFMESKLKQGWEEMELSKTSKSLGKPTLKLLEQLKQRYDFFDRLNYFFEKVDEHENLYGGFALKFRENVVQLGRMIAELHNAQYKKSKSVSRKFSDLSKRGWEDSACKDCTKALLEFAYHIEEKRLKLDVKKRFSEAEQIDLGTISSLLAEKHLLRKKPVHSRSPIPITILTERQMNRDFLENHFKKNLLQLRSRTSTVGASSGSRRPPKVDVKDSLDE